MLPRFWFFCASFWSGLAILVFLHVLTYLASWHLFVIAPLLFWHVLVLLVNLLCVLYFVLCACLLAKLYLITRLYSAFVTATALLLVIVYLGKNKSPYWSKKYPMTCFKHNTQQRYCLFSFAFCFALCFGSKKDNFSGYSLWKSFTKSFNSVTSSWPSYWFLLWE